MLKRFVESGADVVFVSSTTHTEQPWTEAAKNALRSIGVKRVEVFVPGRLSRLADRSLGRWEKVVSSRNNSIYDEMPCTLSYKRWFRQLVDSVEPDQILMNYAWFDQLMRHDLWQGVKRTIESHDILLINRSYRDKAYTLLAERASGAPAQQVYHLDLMNECPLPDLGSELEIYDRYDTTIAISKADVTALGSRLKHSRVSLIPISEAPRSIENEYRDGMVLAMGPNPFNQLALGFFCECVWPLAKKLNPRIKAYITGSVQPPCPVPEGIVHLGFVQDLGPLFQRAKFAVSPVFVGTGEQVKIVEYLACGLGVIALDVPTVSRLLQDKKSGILARDASHMAEAISELYTDDSRCRNYGAAAREIVTEDFRTNSSFRNVFL